MAVSGTFYLDSPSLSTATTIYADVYLTVIAADGFYSDGTIVREQSGGVLLPQVPCPSCASACGGSIVATGSQGVYYIDIDLGSGTGASIIQFQPFSIPDGIVATFNGINYSGVSSPLYGWLQGTYSTLPTYLGVSTEDCGLVSGSPHLLSVYNYSGSAFVPTGSSESISILALQLDLTVSDPGVCIMVIPKTTASPTTLTLKVIGACPTTGFNINASCAEPLTSFASSSVGVDSGTACGDAIDQTYYVAHVNGAGGNVLLYDLVYSDPNGQFKLGAGFYRTSASTSGDLLEVDANGVVIAITTCPS